jgi:glutaredoxin
MFADYQNNQKKSTTRKSKEDILAKYFVPRKTNEIFRILPVKPGRKVIEEAYFHAVPMNIAGGKKKHGSIVYCPAHNDKKVQKLDAQGQPMFDANNQPIMIPAPCPLCAKYKKLIAKQDPSIKYIKKENLDEAQKKIKAKNDEIYKEANVWEAKKFYIVRGIDKGAEKDGVKFWRFKHNFKNQGTLDKLLPILNGYITVNNADPTSPTNGTDLNITMTDSEFNGRAYKTISAIMFRGKSLLHSDPIIMQQWLDDTITWREVFKPKTAPIITPYEVLEMIANGTNPYWDDSDATNKHWVFPGRPDLEEQANTRNRNLDADDEDANFEYASDIDDEDGYRVTINNVTERNVGSYKDDAVDLAVQTLANKAQAAPAQIAPITTNEESQEDTSTGSKYDDLPF